MTKRPARRFLAVVVLGAALSGCGVTTQDQPKTIDPDEVPFELLRNAPTVTTTTTGPLATTSPSLPAPGTP